LKFRVWPNRGAPLETTFRQELEAALKQENAEFQPWMIAIAYEIGDRDTASVGFSWLLRRVDLGGKSRPAARRRSSNA
jgi:small conductance mechanosensitive channel